MTGPVPKNPADRIRTSKDKLTPGMEIAYDGVKRGAALPMLENGDWCDRTIAWWETWRMSPQAQLMGETDWDAMLEAALIHNQIWSNQGLLKPAELATLVKQLHAILQNYGLTYGDRLKLRIKLADDIPDKTSDGITPHGIPDNVISMYRDRLGA